MAHAAEGALRRGPQSDHHADGGRGARGRSSEALPGIVADPRDHRRRGADALYGAWLCGTVLGSVAMALHHKLCHTLGGSFDLPHAETHAIMLPHTIGFNAVAVPDLLRRSSDIFGASAGRRPLRFCRSRSARRPRSATSGWRKPISTAPPTIAVAKPYANPRPFDAARDPRAARRRHGPGRPRLRHELSKLGGNHEMITRRRLAEGRRRHRPARRHIGLAAAGDRAGRARSSSAMSARRPGRSPPSPRPTTSSSTASRTAARRRRLNVEVIVKDSQSNPNRAAEVAKELIVDDEIDLMLVASTPETTNPVSTTCETEGMPCISTVAPWQPWFIGQQANPGDPGIVEAVQLRLPLLLGPRGRHRRLHQHVGAARDQQEGRRPVPERRRRQRLGRSQGRLPAGARTSSATRSPTPAATRT